MKVKNIIISLSSALIISAALPAAADQDTKTHYMMHGGSGPQGHQMEGDKHSADQSQMHKVLPPHTDTPSATDTHYMMHGGKGEQGHLMEGTKHAANQATEHQTQLITSSLTNSTQSKHYMMNSGDGPQGYLMEGKDHPKR
jgi:hypothetical protein